MTQETNKEINAMITTLYLTRGQVATVDIIGAWLSMIGEYPLDKIKKAFHRYIKYGDNYPSLPSIIALIENRVDSDTASIDAWANIRKAMKASSSKSLTASEKEVMNRVSGGLTACIDASPFDISQIERDFKKMYKAGYDGISREILIEPSGSVHLLQSAQQTMIDNKGMFKNE